MTEELKKKVESVLFSAGSKLSLGEIGKIVGESDEEKLQEALDELRKDLEKDESPIMLVKEGEGYKLSVREKYLPLAKKIVPKTELPKSVLKTLAVVAFKAPVLQTEVIDIRNNKAYNHLKQLEERGYIRREKQGRTKKIELTEKFYEYFDISPEDLDNKFEEEASEKVQELEVYDREEEIHTHEESQKPVEEYDEKLGELEVYDSEGSDKIDLKEDQSEEESKEKSEKESTSPIEEISEEKSQEAQEEEVSDEEESKEGEEEPEEREFSGKHLFEEGIPEDVAEKVEKRVKELTEGEEESDEA